MRSYKDISPDDFRTRLLGWIESLRVQDGPYGTYRGSSEGSVPPGLYPSFYAAITRYFYRDIEAISQAKKEQWIHYIASYQDAENGWFDDPSIRFFSSGKRGINEFLHQTSFSVTALECLGAGPRHPLRFVQRLSKSIEAYRRWLDSLEWQVNPWMASVWLMFSFFLSLRDLIARGFPEDSKKYKSLVAAVFEWLAEHQDPATGYWGTERGASLYQGFGAALHHWILYDAFAEPLNHVEKSIDNTLSMQRKDGHFGMGLGQTDYDMAFALYFLSKRTAYRKRDISLALERLLDAQFNTWNEDGGFYSASWYTSFDTTCWCPKPYESDLVAAYFRTKCLFYSCQVVASDNPLAKLFKGISLSYR